jgi:hypothetical protein
LFRSLYEFLI